MFESRLYDEDNIRKKLVLLETHFNGILDEIKEWLPFYAKGVRIPNLNKAVKSIDLRTATKVQEIITIMRDCLNAIDSLEDDDG